MSYFIVPSDRGFKVSEYLSLPIAPCVGEKAVLQVSADDVLHLVKHKGDSIVAIEALKAALERERAKIRRLAAALGEDATK